MGDRDRPGLRGDLGPWRCLTVSGYPVAIIVVCVKSFSRLWVVITNRHSERQAANPRRWNRSIRRLYLTCPNTGAMIDLRCA